MLATPNELEAPAVLVVPAPVAVDVDVLSWPIGDEVAPIAGASLAAAMKASATEVSWWTSPPHWPTLAK